MISNIPPATIISTLWTIDATKHSKEKARNPMVQGWDLSATCQKCKLNWSYLGSSIDRSTQSKQVCPKRSQSHHKFAILMFHPGYLFQCDTLAHETITYRLVDTSCHRKWTRNSEAKHWKCSWDTNPFGRRMDHKRIFEVLQNESHKVRTMCTILGLAWPHAFERALTRRTHWQLLWNPGHRSVCNSPSCPV